MKQKLTDFFLHKLLLIFLSYLLISDAQASSSAWQETEHSAVRLISALKTLGSQKELKLGLEFKLKKGWKIYWRSPGDAGFPPEIDWTGSKNLMEAKLHWPAPKRFSVLGLETLGYTNNVILPISAQAITDKQRLNLNATVKYLTCKDICIPYDATLRLDLKAGKGAISDFFQSIDKYFAQVPKYGGAHGLKIKTLQAESSGKNLVLKITADSLTKFSKPDIFIEGPVGLIFTKPIIHLSNDKYRAVLTVRVKDFRESEKKYKEITENVNLTITLADGNRSEERSFTLTLPKTKIPSKLDEEKKGASLFLILLFSLIGGFILNFMPCVLPVLSLKLLSILQL